MKKSARRRHKHCAPAVVRWSRKFRPAADPLPGGTGRSKFNQLEMVITFTYKQFGEVRVILVTDPQLHTDRTNYNTLHRSFASTQRN